MVLTRENLDVWHPDFPLALVVTVATLGDHAAAAAVGGSVDHLVEGDDCPRRINVCCSRPEDVDFLTVSEERMAEGERDRTRRGSVQARMVDRRGQEGGQAPPPPPLPAPPRM